MTNYEVIWATVLRRGEVTRGTTHSPTPDTPRRHRHACLFFFQAEDGIRDYKVTGVQTCALPIQAEDGIRGLQGDWSSDVCSSDLILIAQDAQPASFISAKHVWTQQP